MEKLMIADEYQIKNEVQLSYEQLNVLTRLYLPVIGKNAFTLYLAMIGESDLTHIFTSFFSIGRLTMITDLTLDQIKEACTTLEGIGLIKSYVKYGTVNQFIFEIHSPLNAKNFFNNQLYNVLLYRTLKEEDYEKTKYPFITQQVNLKEFEEVSSSFKDAFYFNYNSTDGKQVMGTKNIRENEAIEVNAEYDLDLFFKELTQLQIRRDSFTKDELKLISQYGMIYSIDGINLANLVVECMENNHLDLNMLSQRVKNYNQLDMNMKFEAVYRKQPYEQRSHLTGNDKRIQKIRQMESLSPYEFIQAKQQSTPIRSDLAIVEKCMVDIGLNSGVMNVLLDLTWALNDNQMPRAYMEKVAASWQRKGIKTVEQAMNEAKEYLKSRKAPAKKVETKPVKVEKQAEVYDEDYLQKLMKKAGL